MPDVVIGPRTIRTAQTIAGLIVMIGFGVLQTNRANFLAAQHPPVAPPDKEFVKANKQNDAASNQSDGISSAVAISTLVILVGQSWIFAKQAIIMRRTAEIYERQAVLMSGQLKAAADAASAAIDANAFTRKIFVANQRPWIPAKIEVIRIERKENAVNAEVAFILENIGQSPAFDLGVRAYLLPKPFDIRYVTSNIERLSQEVAAQSHFRSRVGGNHLFPKGTYRLLMNIPLVNLSLTETVWPNEEPLILVLYGQISYRMSKDLDTDPKFRETSFHYEIGSVNLDRRQEMAGLNLALDVTFHKEHLVLRQEFSGTKAT